MSKYIIKNCPCNVTTEDMCDWENTNETYCKDCTDCVMKQIVERCKNIDCPCCYKGDGCDNCTTAGQKELAEKIIKLLQIEEVE